MGSDTVIRVDDVSKRFVIRKDNSLKERLVNARRSKEHREEFWALRNVSLDIQSGHTLGLIGHNGSGKSTLLKLIGGILTPTSGFVERRGRLAALLELGAGFHPDLTGRENVYLNASILGLTRKQTDLYFDSIVDFAGIEPFIDTQVKFYSSGMYIRLAFAVAVHVDPEILLVDEVLAVGDEPFQRKCLDRIKQFQHDGRTIVLVTHSLEQVRQMCDRVVLLESGIVVVDGEPSDAVRHFREQNSEVDSIEQASQRHDIVIEKVRITDSTGAPRTVFDSHHPLTIAYDIVAEATVDDWAAGVAITDGSGMLLYGTNTVLQRRDLEPIRGTRTIRFDFDDLPLSEGQYFVTVAVHPAHGMDYHRIDRAASFQIRSGSTDPGVITLTPKIDISDG
ncbi:MAG: transporter ATP-binding protein [Jatrophihabitans sp.]|nr:transporter ATP-binding protein [Jatrophihabitans sp.]MDT4902404.1 type transport system ATP-binding protein [Pseudonocardiales bacterium]MDT4931343.1 type transport system ATP-binding protein [Pseudonocardiales bacterium]MDT4948422.1 type transport system ATP-binding protein [Pseudonocardiales bacterium]